jgi:hypothetical protein
VTKIGQNREPPSVSLHRPASIEQFDPQRPDIARRFLWGRGSLLHCYGNAAHCTISSFGTHRSARGFAACIGVANSQDVPFDSVSDCSKHISRQFTATIILIDQRKDVPREVGRCVAKNG